MSVCDPNNACGDCCSSLADFGPDLVFAEPELTEEQRADLEDMETRLKALRLEARGLKRSGNPAVKAEGKAGLAYIEDQLRWVRSELSKGDVDV